jgi:hypothetical protein
MNIQLVQACKIFMTELFPETEVLEFDELTILNKKLRYNFPIVHKREKTPNTERKNKYGNSKENN